MSRQNISAATVAKRQPVRRSQAERRAESEQRLLDAAAEILVNEGFVAATFDRISERAGYSRGMVTERFGSKDALIEAAIRSIAQQMGARSAEKGGPDASPMMQLVAKVDALFWGLKNGIASAYFVLLSATVANRLPQISYFRDHHRHEKSKYVRLLAREQESGRLNSELDIKTLAILLGCLEIGIAIQAQVDPDLDFDALQSALHTLLLLLDGSQPLDVNLKKN